MTQTDESVIVPTRFSEQIRAATWADHGTAEHATFMDALMAGNLSRGQYAEMIVQLWFVYGELEDAVATQADDPVVAPFVDPVLDRVPALEADLDVLLGSDWRAMATATPETQTYVDRLREVGAGWPGGVVAHHYTRYLGDLSGGQYIGRLVSKLYDLTPDAGAAFYTFSGIDDPAAFKDGYRAALDAAPFDDDERLRVIDEIHAAYAFNTLVLVGLGNHLLAPD